MDDRIIAQAMGDWMHSRIYPTSPLASVTRALSGEGCETSTTGEP